MLLITTCLNAIISAFNCKCDSLLVRLDHSLECGQRSLDHIIAYAVRKSEIAGASKSVSGNYEQVVIQLSLFRICNCITVWSLYEEIESTVRLSALISVLSESVVEKISVLIVGSQVRHLTNALADNLLNQSRRAYRSDLASSTGNRII